MRSRGSERIVPWATRPDLHAARAPAKHREDRSRRRHDPHVINQADVIIGGDASALTWVKVALNYCVPFVVSNLGLLAGKRAEAEHDGARGGDAA